MNLNVKKILKNISNHFFWGQHPETALRYLPIIKEIRNAGLENSKIVEIGSGSTGITPYFRKNIDGIDINFEGPKSKYINKIKGEAYNLPFKNNSYDVTLSVDVLEHINLKLRQKSIYEQLRITKKLALIVVPSGNLSQKQDIELKKRWHNTFNKNNIFLDEHVKFGLPKHKDMEIYIENSLKLLNKKASIYSYGNLNLNVRKFLMLNWISKNKFNYYLYLKGFLLLIPLLKFCNFGEVYRRVFVVKFA